MDLWFYEFLNPVVSIKIIGIHKNHRNSSIQKSRKRLGLKRRFGPQLEWMDLHTPLRRTSRHFPQFNLAIGARKHTRSVAWNGHSALARKNLCRGFETLVEILKSLSIAPDPDSPANMRDRVLRIAAVSLIPPEISRVTPY